MSGMTSIYVGVSGLQSSQTGLNTTAHNISNMYTEGYTRQLSIKGDKVYITQGQTATSLNQVGLGVETISTSRYRSRLLDKAFRTENSRTEFYDAQYDAATEISTILGEINGESFDDTLSRLENAIQEVAKTPNDEAAQAELVMYAEQFIERAGQVYDGFYEYQCNLNQKILGMVDTVNSIGAEINKLNQLISGTESPGIENANDLRDTRDLLLDKLSGYVGITYVENENNYVTVNIEGVPFVTEAGVYEMATEMRDTEKESSFVTCYWPHVGGQEVFHLSDPIDTTEGTDKGSLKGYLYARGDFTAKYTDIPQIKDYNLTTAAGKAQYDADVKTYMENVDSCSVVKAEAMFDSLIHGIVTRINDVLCPNISGMPAGVTSFTDADGNTYPDGTVYTAANIEYLDANTSTGADGKLPPQELFSRKDADRYIEVTGDDGNTYYIVRKNNKMGYESLYTCRNLEINKKVLDDYSKLPFTAQGTRDEDFAKATNLANAWSGKFANLTPGSLTELNFNSYYDQFVYDIGNDGELYYNLTTNEASATKTIDEQRTQITGVSGDEELTNYMKFQQAYNASSRYINVVSEMLEHIITSLGH